MKTMTNLTVREMTVDERMMMIIKTTFLTKYVLSEDKESPCFVDC